jgi:hypothetical protein
MCDTVGPSTNSRYQRGVTYLGQQVGIDGWSAVESGDFQ